MARRVTPRSARKPTSPVPLRAGARPGLLRALQGLGQAPAGTPPRASRLHWRRQPEEVEPELAAAFGQPAALHVHEHGSPFQIDAALGKDRWIVARAGARGSLLAFAPREFAIDDDRAVLLPNDAEIGRREVDLMAIDERVPTHVDSVAPGRVLQKR